jgi:hypothetical protein
MIDNSVPSQSKHIYRVDKFVVPESARDEFLAACRCRNRRVTAG